MNDYVRWVSLIAAVVCGAMLCGCEETEKDYSPQVRVGNYSVGSVIIRVDDTDLGDVVPNQETHLDVREGMHTVKLLRGDESVIFMQNVDLEKRQYVRYIVRSDETVVADGGGV